MESVAHCVVDIYRQRHNKSAVLLLIFTPCHNRGDKLALVKNVDVKMSVIHPRQAGHIEGVRHTFLKSAGIFVFFAVGYIQAVEIFEIFTVFCWIFGEGFVRLIEIGV